MRISEFLRKLQLYAMLALCSYPVAACIVVFYDTRMLPFVWAFSGVLCLVGLVSFVTPAKLRTLLAVLGAAAMLFGCMQLVQGNAKAIMIAFALGYSVILLWSVHIPGWDAARELPATWLGGGTAVLLVACLLAYYEPRLATVAWWLRFSLFTFVLLAMLSLNRGSLRLATAGGRGFSGAMRRKNLFLTLALFGAALLVGLIPSAIHLIKWLIDWLGQLFANVAALFPAETEPATTVTGTTEAFTMGEGMEVLYEDLQTHRTPRSVYIMMAVIAIGVIAPVFLYTMYKLCSLLWRWLYRLTQNLIATTNVQTEDYEDEITDIREEIQQERYREESPRERILPLKTMTPKEQIRHRYKRLEEKDPRWRQSNTARETLPEEAAALYEKARYSDHPITARDAEEFKNKTK